jgi:hypothetical protein
VPLVFVEGNAELTLAKLIGHHNPARVLREDHSVAIFIDGRCSRRYEGAYADAMRDLFDRPRYAPAGWRRAERCRGAAQVTPSAAGASGQEHRNLGPTVRGTQCSVWATAVCPR